MYISTLDESSLEGEIMFDFLKSICQDSRYNFVQGIAKTNRATMDLIRVITSRNGRNLYYMTTSKKDLTIYKQNINNFHFS